MNEFEDRLTDALTNRSSRVRPGAGSMTDVRRRARRRARRRTAVGAGAVAVVGAVGAVALLARNGDGGGGRIASLDGAAAGDDAGDGIWRCTGLVRPPIDDSTATTTIVPFYTTTSIADQASTTSIVDVPMTTSPIGDPTTTSLWPDEIATSTTVPFIDGFATSTIVLDPGVGDDGVYYMEQCDPIGDGLDAPATTTVTRDPQVDTTVPAVASTTTVSPLGFEPTPENCLSESDSGWSLNPNCWYLLNQASDPTTYADELTAYVAASLPQPHYSVYRVQAGDALFSIASSAGLTAEQLAAANGGDVDMVIFRDQPLLIPDHS